MSKYASKTCHTCGNIITLTYSFDPETYDEIVIGREFKEFDNLVKWTMSKITADNAKASEAEKRSGE